MRTRNDGTAVSWLFATLNFFKPSPHHLVSHDSQNLNCVTSLLRDPQCHPVVLIIKLPVLPPLVRCDTIGPRPALLTCLLALPSLTCFLLHEEVTLMSQGLCTGWSLYLISTFFLLLFLCVSLSNHPVLCSLQHLPASGMISSLSFFPYQNICSTRIGPCMSRLVLGLTA